MSSEKHIPMRLVARIRRIQQRFDAHAARLVGADAGVPSEEGLAEIERAAAAVRAEFRKAPPRRMTL